MSGDKLSVKSPMRQSNVTSSKLNIQTHEVWQPRINRTLTNEDARAITENITGFFEVLIEWSRNATPDLSHKFTESANSKISGVCYD